MVATLAEVTGSIALQSMCNQMMSDPTGQRILNDRSLVNTQSIDISKLANLPAIEYIWIPLREILANSQV
jgi:ubiquinone biosynthesis protein Coq4